MIISYYLVILHLVKKVYDDFNVENNIQYELGFEYKNNWNGDKYVSTEIKLDDEYYYGKKINIVSKRQFRHMYYHVQEDTNIFDLNPDLDSVEMKISILYL